MTRISALCFAFLLGFLSTAARGDDDLKAPATPPSDHIYSAATNAWILGTGIYRGGDLGTSQAYWGVEFGYQWKLSAQYEFRLIWDGQYTVAKGGSSSFILFGGGLNYLLADRDCAAIIGLDVGFSGSDTVPIPIDFSQSSSTWPKERSSGAGAAIRVGYRFFTRLRFPFEFDLRYAQLFFDPNFYGDPRMLGASLSILL